MWKTNENYQIRDIFHTYGFGIDVVSKKNQLFHIIMHSCQTKKKQ